MRGVPPSASVCAASTLLRTAGFVGALSTMLAKAFRIQAIFNSKSLKTVSISELQLVVGVSVTALIALLIHLVKHLTTPYAATVLALESNSLLTFATCTGGGGSASTVWSAFVYGYPAALLAYGVYMGWQTRNVPSHFNESSQIALIIFNTGACS